MDAFWKLSTERPGGMGIYPIPYSVALAHFRDRLRLAPDVARAGAEIVMALDGAFMTWQRDEVERRSG